MLRQVTWSLPPPHAVDAWDSDAEPAKRRILIYFCLVEILFVLVPLFQTVSLPNSTDFIFFCFLEAALAIILAIAFINFQVARFIGFFAPHILFLLVFNPSTNTLTPVTLLLHTFTFFVVLMQSLLLTFYRESRLRIVLVVFNLLFFLSIDYSTWFIPDAPHDIYFSLKFAVINTAIILSFVIIRLVRDNGYFSLRQRELLEQLRESNEELNTYNEELAASTEELHSANEMLNHLNQNLEKEVRIRTRDLESKNKQLTDYAYLNAHHLRAPLARIMGVCNLVEIETEPEQIKKMAPMISQAAHELDDVIHEIQKSIGERAVANDKIIRPEQP